LTSSRSRKAKACALKRFPIAWTHAIDQKSAQIQKLKHILIDRIDSIRSEYAPVRFALAALLFHLLPAPAQAEARVAGTPDAVQIEASDATVEEVLAALSEAFDLHYQTSADLHRPVSGSYAGPLRQVVSRLLKGYDFVMETSPAGVLVAVYGSGANANNSSFAPGAVSRPSGVLPPPQGLAAQQGEGMAAPGKNAAVFRARRPVSNIP